MAKETIKEMLKMIDAKINHIEDMTADHRSIIVKLVTQSNSIVKFLAQLEINEIPDIDDGYNRRILEKNVSDKKLEELKELMEEFKERHSKLSELEEELEKHKDEITPGEVGEA